MKRRLWEIGKDILIVLLICSLLLLSAASLPSESVRSNPWLSSVLQPFAALLGLPQSELAYVETALPVLDAAQPLAISVQNSAGRTTAMWDFSALDAAFESLGGLLGQALDTADGFSQVSQTRLLTAMTGPSVYFYYGVSLPANLLASWLDASMDGEVPAASVCVLALEEDTVTLYLAGEACYAAATGVQADTLSGLLEQFRPDGSQFAFESGSKLDALSLIPGVSPTVSAVSTANLCDTRYMEQLATDLGFNPYGDGSYTDAAGNTYFAESNCSLQITPEGSLLLNSSAAGRFEAAGDSLDSLVEEARRLVDLAASGVLGDARIYLTGLEQDGETTVCTFDYILSGIPVSIRGGHAASVTFRGKAVSQMEMQVTSYTRTTETLNLLPANTAAAILPAGSQLALQYSDAGTGKLTAGWVQP